MSHGLPKMLLRKFLTTFNVVLESEWIKRQILLSHRVFTIKSGPFFNVNMGCPFSKQSGIMNVHENKNTMEQEGVNDENPNDFIEEVVCKTSDVGEKDLKSFNLGEGQVLLIRQNGTLNAIGTKCTHYGAPLVSSALGDGRVRCQWHGACFNIANGDIEDFPGLDSLPCYKVTVEGEDVKVRARISELKSNKRIKTMAQASQNNNEHIVVLGGGPSGAVCVETLRQGGFTGKITLVTKDNYLPYDRIKIDKVMDIPIASIQFREADFYASHKIDVLKSCAAIALNVAEKQVKLSNGNSINYSSLYIATGCSARKPSIPGSDLKNVVTIREYDDATYINSQLGPDKHVVVLGSSFIGMEAAAYCIGKVEKVTVISKDSVPFEKSLGKEVGASVLNLFTEKGVNFIANSGIISCKDNGKGAIESVELSNGEILKADVCIMGVGTNFNTAFLKDSGIELDRGAVVVNEYLETSVPNVFAGGDIACAPVFAHNNEKHSIGHYGLAQYHGKWAAHNMLKKEHPIKAVPFFWTMLFGKSLRYAGHGIYDDIIYSGNVAELKFVAYYLKNNVVVAICASQMDPIVSQYAEFVYQGKKLHREDLKDNPLAWSQ